MLEPRTVTRAAVTRDTLFGGQLHLTQPARGYRTNVDALLLAHFAAPPGRAQLAVDLGAGVGAVALALHHRGAAGRLELIERDDWLCELARRNLLEAGADGDVHCQQLGRAPLPPGLAGAADLVVCNPPFYQEGAHRPSKLPDQRGARFGHLAPFLDAARHLLKSSRSRAAFVYPAPALPELLQQASAHGLVPKRLRCVHSRAEAPARLVLLEVRRARPGGLVMEAPLIEWLGSGQRTAELRAVTGASAGDRS